METRTLVETLDAVRRTALDELDSQAVDLVVQRLLPSDEPGLDVAAFGSFI